MIKNISKTHWLSSALVLILCLLCLGTAYRHTSMIVTVCCLLLFGIAYFGMHQQFKPLEKNEKFFIFALIFFFVSALLSYLVGSGWELKSIRNPSMPSLIDLDLPSKYLFGALLFYGFVKLDFKLCQKVLSYAIGLGGIINGGIGIYERYALGSSRIDGFSGIAEMADASAILGIFALIFFIFSHSTKERLFYLFAGYMGIFATILTGTRGAMLGVIFTLTFVFVLIALFQRNYLKTSLWIFLVGVLSFGSVLLVSGGIQDSMRLERAGQDLKEYQDGNAKTSIGMRFEMWKEAVVMFKMAPVFGLSTAEIQKRMPEILQKSHSQLDRLSQVQNDARGNKHNQILNQAAKRGIVGVIAIFLIWLASFKLFIPALKQNNRIEFIFGLLGTCMIFYFIFPNSFTGEPWESNVSFPLMILFICAFYKIIKQSQSNAN